MGRGLWQRPSRAAWRYVPDSGSVGCARGTCRAAGLHFCAGDSRWVRARASARGDLLFRPQATRSGSRVVGRFPAAMAGAVVAIAVLVVGAPARAAIPQFTPITASVLAPPEPVRATDGRRHVVYEVLLRNTTEVSVDVQSLAVRAKGR